MGWVEALLIGWIAGASFVFGLLVTGVEGSLATVLVAFALSFMATFCAGFFARRR